MNKNFLVIENLSSWYGTLQALEEVCLKIGEGEIVTLIGANGAGKSTTLKSILGLVKQRTGHISLLGEDLINLSTIEIVQKGCILVPEGRRIFTELTVTENLEIGAITLRDPKQVKHRLEHVYFLFPRLRERAGQMGGTLSGGEQQMLAIGRGLMGNPKLLMLDEPSMGLAPMLVREVFKLIQEINEEGTTVLLVEQNARKALQISTYAYVLEIGRIAAEGKSRDLTETERIKEIYLGGG